MADASERKRTRLTSRGTATKARIVAAAAKLIYARGAERVSLDEVMEASGTSKSQLYHYFADKEDLIRAVIAFQADRIVESNAAVLDRLDSLEGLRAWRDMTIAASRANGGFGGCPLGALANELAATSEATGTLLDESFAAWGAVIAAGLARMKARGRLVPTADTKALAVAALAAIQGGLLLSKSARSARPLELAFDMALGHIERCAAKKAEPPRSTRGAPPSA